MAAETETRLTLFQKLFKAISVPGTEAVFQLQAPSHVPPTFESSDEKDISEYKGTVKVPKGRLDRYLDVLVRISGSVPMFVFLSLSIITWALLGIKFGRDTDWQVFVSDYQALLTYFFDSLLMRQQFIQTGEQLYMFGMLQSRQESYRRMTSLMERNPSVTDPGSGEKEMSDTVDVERGIHLPTEKGFTRFMRKGSNIVGHIYVSIVFWTGVIIWIGLGNKYTWSDSWQLYMNSVTSAMMVLLFALIALIREQQSEYQMTLLETIDNIDVKVEETLRRLTNDHEPHPTILIVPKPIGILQRTINYYAGFISMLTGIIILCCVVAVWIVVGPVMKFDPSWWLLIGTYAGLVGMNDGFVLRNVAAQLSSRIHDQLSKIIQTDKDIIHAVKAQRRPNDKSAIDGADCTDCTDHIEPHKSITTRISNKIDEICSHRYTTLAGFIVLIGLIVGASAIHWNFTGQLLCNVPPSIIETFLMIILITGHNSAIESETQCLKTIYEARMEMLDLIRV